MTKLLGYVSRSHDTFVIKITRAPMYTWSYWTNRWLLLPSSTRCFLHSYRYRGTRERLEDFALLMYVIWILNVYKVTFAVFHAESDFPSLPVSSTISDARLTWAGSIPSTAYILRSCFRILKHEDQLGIALNESVVYTVKFVQWDNLKPWFGINIR